MFYDLRNLHEKFNISSSISLYITIKPIAQWSCAFAVLYTVTVKVVTVVAYLSRIS